MIRSVLLLCCRVQECAVCDVSRMSFRIDCPQSFSGVA